MSLFPIIYSSLLIFTVIFILVLLTSYISHKLKNSRLEAVPAKNLKIDPRRIVLQTGNSNNPSFRSNLNLINNSRLYAGEIRSSYPVTKSEYRRDQKHLNDSKKIDVIYKHKRSQDRKSQIYRNDTRFSIIKDIGPVTDNKAEKVNVLKKVEEPIIVQVPENYLLRYYDDY